MGVARSGREDCEIPNEERAIENVPGGCVDVERGVDSEGAVPDERAAETVSEHPVAECGGLLRPHGGGRARAALVRTRRAPEEDRRDRPAGGQSDPRDYRARRRSPENDLSSGEQRNLGGSRRRNMQGVQRGYVRTGEE